MPVSSFALSEDVKSSFKGSKVKPQGPNDGSWMGKSKESVPTYLGPYPMYHTIPFDVLE